MPELTQEDLQREIDYALENDDPNGAAGLAENLADLKEMQESES